jgi:hypothetical protein
VDAYGLTDRAGIVPALQRSPLASAERVRYAPVDAAGAAASLEFLAGELRWIHGISADLARALRGGASGRGPPGSGGAAR